MDWLWISASENGAQFIIQCFWTALQWPSQSTWTRMIWKQLCTNGSPTRSRMVRGKFSDLCLVCEAWRQNFGFLRLFNGDRNNFVKCAVCNEMLIQKHKKMLIYCCFTLGSCLFVPTHANKCWISVLHPGWKGSSKQFYPGPTGGSSHRSQLRRLCLISHDLCRF